MPENQLAFIWDMDGTLVDSYPAIVPAATEVLNGLGVEISAEEVHAEVIRSSVAALLEQIAGERGWDALALKQSFNRLNDSRIDRIRPMPRCAEALAALREQGHLHFVYTHRGASAAAILERTGLAGYFTEVVTALNGFPRKPAPDGIRYLLEKYVLDPARCFYVGDRSLDVLAAAAARVGSILYLDPESPGQPTGQEDWLVRDLLEIPGLTGKLLNREEA